MIAAHKNVRILLSLLKQYNIRHFVISPGSRNISVVKSVEDDPFFTCYSVVDERSAAYFAVGLSLEVRAPVAISCTSAQATRNYLPGMTEAYYRKAPILAVTTDYDESFIGQMNMQAIRQMSIPSDAANVSVDIPIIKDGNDAHLVTRRINEALDALSRKGGGPAHINLRINEHWVRGGDELESARRIARYLPMTEEWPSIGKRKVLIVVGEHHPFSSAESQAIADFAHKYDVAIYVNHISNYNGHKSVHGNLRLATGDFDELRPDLVITIGGLLGDYPIDGKLKKAGVEHWRVCEDGHYADTYNTLVAVFECPESYFFERMAEAGAGNAGNTYYESWQKEIGRTRVPEDFPLSLALVAQRLSRRIPQNSIMHFGILNNLRAWEFFPLDPSLRCYSNVAGFGIDGGMSTFIGQSVASKELNFLIIGDLSFFYDMNSIGIRHLRNNVRIVLVNNHGGAEFRLRTNAADKFGDDSNRHIAAVGHFGDSAEGWVRNNRFRYFGVMGKEELDGALEALVQPSDEPIVLEVFTRMADDANALHTFMEANDRSTRSQRIALSIKDSIPHDLKRSIKKIIGR